MKIDGKNRRQMIKLHREMWDWLYKNSSMTQKAAWPRWRGQGGDIKQVDCECFACYHASKISEGCTAMTGGCPLFRWGTEENSCVFADSYFDRWSDAKTNRIRKKYAKLIRDLPVRRARR